PANVALGAVTTTSLALSWSPSTDNVGVAGYGVYVNGSRVAMATTPSYTAFGLSCGTSYKLAVDAVDAAGNRSERASLTASTAACGGGGGGTVSCTRTLTPSDSLSAVLNSVASGSTVCLASGSYSGDFAIKSSVSNLTLTAAPGAATTPVI